MKKNGAFFEIFLHDTKNVEATDFTKFHFLWNFTATVLFTISDPPGGSMVVRSQRFKSTLWCLASH